MLNALFLFKNLLQEKSLNKPSRSLPYCQSDFDSNKATPTTSKANPKSNFLFAVSMQVISASQYSNIQ